MIDMNKINFSTLIKLRDIAKEEYEKACKTVRRYSKKYFADGYVPGRRLVSGIADDG